jgi:hypothetical protein
MNKYQKKATAVIAAAVAVAAANHTETDSTCAGQ